MIVVRAKLPSPCHASMMPSGRWRDHSSRVSLSIQAAADAARGSPAGEAVEQVQRALDRVGVAVLAALGVSRARCRSAPTSKPRYFSQSAASGLKAASR